MTYLIKRGIPALVRKRHAHLARYDEFGRIVGPWCVATALDMSINVPLGLKTCRHCLNARAKAWEAAHV